MAEQTAGLQSFIELIETIADNKYVMGDRLVEVGVSGPNLEATLAAIAMAQGELGHARLLYNWSFDLKELKKKPDIESQTGKAFPAIVNVNNWIALIASLYAANVAIDLVLRAVLDSGQSKAASRIQKLINEQNEHLIYSENWARQLLNDKGAIPSKFKEALSEAVSQAEAWLKYVEQQTELAEAGYIAKNLSLQQAFKSQIDQLNVQTLVSTK
ncbi:Phenylacetic acid catabolic protein [Pseudobacillus wudalianchiensis]|uniref:Phenylacetic acid catabolism protein n=1 Tax=Pseudobacillus wudalianchiensis TaxID=1743143 RepID=A0A1B9AAJ8_9BACI|nr:Phenylacetic acid catabolic protein [Bacillus wudalianchiensis]OCA80870.1 phenylacetic acid catabolism protein [Bacillus wudalianchiensis]